MQISLMNWTLFVFLRTFQKICFPGNSFSLTVFVIKPFLFTKLVLRLKSILEQTWTFFEKIGIFFKASFFYSHSALPYFQCSSIHQYREITMLKLFNRWTWMMCKCPFWIWFIFRKIKNCSFYFFNWYQNLSFLSDHGEQLKQIQSQKLVNLMKVLKTVTGEVYYLVNLNDILVLILLRTGKQ